MNGNSAANDNSLDIEGPGWKGQKSPDDQSLASGQRKIRAFRAPSRMRSMNPGK